VALAQLGANVSRRVSLVEAAGCNLSQVVISLLQNDPGSRGSLGAALAAAAAGGCIDTLRLLLAGGALANSCDGDGVTPLMLAAQHGQCASIRALREYGGALDQRDRAGETALMRAARAGQAAAVELLVALGAQLGTRNEQNQSAYDLAAGLSGRERLNLQRGGGSASPSSPVAAAAAADEDVPADLACLICLCERKTMALLHGDTAHVVACAGCAPLLLRKPCPVCRAIVERVFPMAHVYS
jgi:hypothetical protein